MWYQIYIMMHVLGFWVLIILIYRCQTSFNHLTARPQINLSTALLADHKLTSLCNTAKSDLVTCTNSKTLEYCHR